MPYSDQINDFTPHVHTYFWVTTQYKYHGQTKNNNQPFEEDLALSILEFHPRLHPHRNVPALFL